MELSSGRGRIFNQHRLLGEKRKNTWIYEDKKNTKPVKNRLKTGRYTCRSLWIAGRRDSTVFGVVDDTTTTKFANHACAVHGISLPVVVDKVVVVVLKFPIDRSNSTKRASRRGEKWKDDRSKEKSFNTTKKLNFTSQRV